ncbi:nanoRNase/pAp phosphatase (c-di-AMP/oligoRNAs hydrolase) [Methanomicrobium sp. W14]|jgi:nanoRNase/pAp phosphatase (c-di-AMP/oligoRNAs hydrolase)|uniref:DHH family phosphoesterase n=1 Tax=Methanomicrobium sp. W14 TaxID=2817839 RepID=UPI001AE26AB1|nr:DHH family phosphoesterase [Methanomicrobium sp. W14]MBP2133049.1 nanoRNase/pAp phosphatase (c-di-AMP/oligoRNAs hydrolase) [Methanomicrobium sp. W14]
MPESLPNGNSDRVKYMVLGCGSIGYNVVEELVRDTEHVVVVDHDEKRVEDLRDQNYEAITKDITDPALFEGLPVPEVVFVLSSDKNANLEAVRKVKDIYPSAYVIARAIDRLSLSLLEQAGADIALYPQEVFAKTAVHHIRRLHSSRLARKLYHFLSECEGVLGIVLHTNPDPDAISSAMALCALGKEASGGKLECKILYDGKIGHQENRAFVTLLDIQLQKITLETCEEMLGECNYLALVDSSSPGSNNFLSPDRNVDIIIDHHKMPDDEVRSVHFVDIRPGVGATASIMTQYLQELDISVDQKVATALLYGIRADTRDFSRNITPQDLNYAAFLLPLTDSELLDKITSPSMSIETVDALGDAIKNRKVQNGYLFTNVGYIKNRDVVPQAADLLIQLEGINTSVAYGIGDDYITISARNKDIRMHVGNVMKEAFEGVGEAGGHATMAAARIPLNSFSLVKNKEELLSLIIDPLLKRFADIVGLGKEEQNEV